MENCSVKRCTGRFTVALIALAVVAAALVGVPPILQAQQENPNAQEGIAALENLGDAFAKISEETSPAVVFISVEKNIQRRPRGGQFGPFPGDLFERFFGMPDPHGSPQGPRGMQPEEDEGSPVPFGQGSGFIVSADGYILTNHHVVGEADAVSVTLGDGREYDAELVGSDPLTEIAVLKIDASNLPYLKLGNSDNLRVGQWVLAIGSPFGLSHSVTAGIVSATGRGSVGIQLEYADFIQTDAAINPGNSGGPLINLHGEVIGMNTAILSRSGGNLGIGFAIPVNMIQYIKDQIIGGDGISRGFLGIEIQNLSPQLAEYFGLGSSQGVLIVRVEEDSPADRAGLEANDVIVEYNGHSVDESGAFRSRVATTAPGESVSIVVQRDGERVEKTVVIGTLSADMRTLRGPEGSSKVELGLAVQNLTDDIAARFGYETESGVVVTAVEPGSAAARAGMRPGMLIQEVNGTKVRNAGEFKKALESSEKNIVLFRVRFEDGSGLIAVEQK